MSDKLSPLKTKLKEQNLDGLLISSVSNITYLTGYSNFSEIEREAFVIITKNESFIITDARYSEAVRKEVAHFKLIELSVKKPLAALFKDVIKNNHIKKLGFEEENLTVSEFKKFSFTPERCKATKNIVENLRTIKTLDEIGKIEKACKIGDKAFDHVLKKIKVGLTEKQLAFELELFIKKQGFELSFPSIVAFGPNSSIPHHQTSNAKLKKNSIVLLDFGVRFNNYCSDMSRTVFFGKASKEQKHMYEAVLKAQKKAFNCLNSLFIIHNSKTKTVKARNIDKAARDYIVSQGYPTIPHSLGHGIGIEVHESPRLSPISKDELKPGMVFSIEPGIYIPGFGGIRIEDLVVLTQNGPRFAREARRARFLTRSPKHLIELFK